MVKIKVSWKKITFVVLILGLIFLYPLTGPAEETLSESNKKVLNTAQACRKEIYTEIDQLFSNGKLTKNKLFDTFYIPIPNTNPQKYHSQYDRIFDENMRPILDSYLSKDKRFLFVILVDRNGYVPTHNAIYSIPNLEDRELDVKWNRTKRIFNDRTGLAAARNTKPYLLQDYERDTGETVYDLSVPITVDGRHWGSLRIGFKN